MASLQRRGSKIRAVIRLSGHPAEVKIFKTMEEARAWADAREAALGGKKSRWGNRVDPPVPTPPYQSLACKFEPYSMTLREALEIYQIEESPLKQGHEQEKFRIDGWMRHPISDRLLVDLTMHNFVEWRRSEQIRVGATGKPISPATIRLKVAIISAVYEHARSEWAMPKLINPIRGMKLPKGRRGREVHLSEEQFNVILAEAKSPTRARYLYYISKLAYLTAMRQGELLAARWENWNHGDVLHLPTTKNGEARSVPLSSESRKLLRKWWEEEERPESGQIFYGVTTPSIVRAWINCVRTVRKRDPSFPHVTFHDLRHVATTNLSKKLTNVLELSAVTGHKSIQVLKRYYNPDPEELAKKLD